MTPDEAITIVTTTSPIPSHPSTWIFDRVYASVRRHLPEAHYLILMDGVHPAQEALRRGYEEYCRTIQGRVGSEWKHTNCVVAQEFTHQAGMIRAVLKNGYITTPLVLWIEHDFPFNELPIEWDGIVQSLLRNDVCYVRFALPEENHKSIQALHTPMFNTMAPMMRTMNYSSLPHVCRLDFLKRLVEEFKEGKIHLECEATEGIAFREEQWRLALYTPPGEIARFYSLDGRAGPEKIAMVL